MGRISKGRNKVRVFHGGRIRGTVSSFRACGTELTTEEKKLDRFDLFSGWGLHEAKLKGGCISTQLPSNGDRTG